MNQFFKKKLTTAIVAAIIILIMPLHVTKAEEFLESEYIGGSNYNIGTSQRPTSLMSFVSSGNAISKLQLVIWKDFSLPSLNINVKICADSGCTSVVWETDLLDGNITTSYQAFVTIIPATPINLTASQTYYIKTVTTGTTGNVYSRGNGISNPGIMNYRAYYDTDNNITQNTNYDYSLAADYPDFNSVISQTCVIGQDCNLWFSFNELAIGYPMYLIYYASSTIPANAISSKLITSDISWQNAIAVPQVSTTTEVKYNLLLDGGTYGWNVKTGITIKWVESDYWENLIIEKYGADITQYCAEEVICDGVSTSSDFFYGVTCGFRQGLCWFLSPTAGSQKYIANSLAAFENSFPFNLYFGFITRTEAIIGAEATTTDGLTMPFIDTNGEVIDLPITSSTTMSDALGDGYDTIKNGLEYFIWIITAVVIAFIIHKFAL